MKDKDAITRLTLLGPFSAVLSDGSVAVFPTQKSQALLAVMALSGPPGIHRDRLADMFWSRSGEGQARANLRQALASLRKALGPDGGCILAEGAFLRLDPARLICDTDAHDDTGGAGQSSLPASTELLAGLSIDEPGFQDWLSTERTRWSERVTGALLKGAKRHLEEQDHAAALSVARNLIASDPYHEAAYRLEMQALHGSGETAAALKSFERLRSLLQTELGIEPGTKTLALYDRLHDKNAPHAATPAPPPIPAQGSDKPNIAVLPFANMSDDPEQKFFSDGITTDIATELSRIRFVSVTTIRDETLPRAGAPDLHEVALAQGVDFILAGSVRRAGARVRITAQLIEAGTGRLAWSERYDRDIEDVFEVQDEVTRSIAAAIPGRLIDAVASRVTRKPPAKMKAYEYVLQGKAIRDDFSAEATAKARTLYQKAIETDPTFARAHSYLADTYFMDFMLGLADSNTTSRFYELMQTAIQLDGRDVAIQEEMGFAYLAVGQWEDASTQFDRAIAMVKTEAEQLMWCGYGLMMCGRHDEALAAVERAKSLDPQHPPSFDWVYGQALFMAGRCHDAVRVLQAGSLLNSIGLACRIGAYAEAGQITEAQSALPLFIEMRRGEFACNGLAPPKDTLEDLAGGYRPTLRRAEDWGRIADGLRRAGLPG